MVHSDVFIKTVRNFVDNYCVSRFFEAQLGFPRDASSLGSELKRSSGGAIDSEIEDDRRECHSRNSSYQQNVVAYLTKKQLFTTYFLYEDDLFKTPFESFLRF
jgi:hypothetical protein